MDITDSVRGFGFFRVGASSPSVCLGNPRKNIENIIESLRDSRLNSCGAIVFPELCITGYTCADLFFQDSLIEEASASLLLLAEKTESDSRLLSVGAPLLWKGRLYNCAVVLQGGKILGVVPKINIPGYQEFYEKRWFESGAGITNAEIQIGGNNVPFGVNLIFSLGTVKIGIEICEDLWVPSPPSSGLCMAGAEIILNLSATDDNIGKYKYIESLVKSQSARCRCVYAYASAGIGESSTDLVFSGIDLVASDGEILTHNRRFNLKPTAVAATVDLEKLRNDRRKYSTFFPAANSLLEYRVIQGIPAGIPASMEIDVDPTPFVPSNAGHLDENCREIVSIQCWGLEQRLRVTGCRSLVIGISGGLDSTLALMIAYMAFQRLGLDLKGIKGVTMPAKATSERTHSNAWKLMNALGVTALEIPVSEAVGLHFRDIGHDQDIYDAVYENSQARERTQILMDLANKYGGMVLGTGDMSELALGWCTYNGDHMSMYNVNAGVPKTLVRHLVKWFAETLGFKDLETVLLDILDTPISPELIPSDKTGEISQKTEDLVGPYELHDFFLFHMIRNGFSPSKIYFMCTQAFRDKYTKEEIKRWLVSFYRRFFSQQFKRSCMPDGPKVGSVCLSPRGDWRMPSDANSSLWIEEAENLEV